MKKYQQFIFGLVIALIALYYTLHNVSFSEVSSSFKEIDHIYIILAAIIVVLGYIFRAYRWRILLEPSLKVNVSELYSPMMVGFMGNFLPARAGEILRPYLLSKKYGITFSAALASIIVERLADLILLFMLFILVFWFEASVFSSNIKFSEFSVQEMAIMFGQFTLLMSLTLVVFIYLLLNHKKKSMKLVHWFTGFLNDKWANKIKYLIHDLAVGCEVVKNFKTLVKISLYSVLIWVTNIFAFYPLYFAFDLQNKTISSLIILIVMVAIFITIFPTPGFLGSYNAGILFALHSVMGESEIKAVSIGIIGWTLYAGVILAGGLYFIFHDHMSLKTLVNFKKERDVPFE